MPTHNDVTTTCTASFITGWDIAGLSDGNEKRKTNVRLQTVNNLIHQGYKSDFALLFAITTQEQIDEFGLDDFFPKIGFKSVFVGEKVDDTDQRHKETGDLTMWCVSPADYKEKLQSYRTELTEIKERIDPPKKIDPARQKFPDLLLSHLRKQKMVQDNASVHNPICEILLVPADRVWAYIKLTYGVDLKMWNKRGEGWTKMTTNGIKEAQKAWKAELV